MKIQQAFCIAALFGLAGSGCGKTAPTTKAVSSGGGATPYYDEGVTEWLDSNGNPVAAEWWVRDDSKSAGGAADADGWYGYTDGKGDWFYDYYDPNPYGHSSTANNGLYDYGYRYYDFNNDGIYDAYAAYYDTNGDGIYDDYVYETFTDAGTDKQKGDAKGQRAKESRDQKVTGTVQKVKEVAVRGGRKHLVVGVQAGDAKDLVAADLGPTDGLKDATPKAGDKVTVTGPKATVGQQTVVLAKSFELNGKTKQVSRSAQTLMGKVVSTKKGKAGGVEHLLATVETKAKDKSVTVPVDLGRADRFKKELATGDTVTVTGFAVKVNDKPLFMAQTVDMGGQVTDIDRKPAPAASGDNKSQTPTTKAGHDSATPSTKADRRPGTPTTKY
jgi:hypothetical protein